MAQWRAGARAQGRLSAWAATGRRCAQASAHDAAARLPFGVNGAPVGSVARVHLQALRAWPRWLHVDADGVALHGRARPRWTRRSQPINARAAPAGPDPRLARRVLRAASTRPPARGWRTMERAAARFWGTLTLGAHANGYVADADGPAHPPVDRAAFLRQGHRPRQVRQPHRRRRARRPDAAAGAGARGLGRGRAAARRRCAPPAPAACCACSATSPKACSTNGCTAYDLQLPPA